MQSKSFFRIVYMGGLVMQCSGILFLLIGKTLQFMNTWIRYGRGLEVRMLMEWIMLWMLKVLLYFPQNTMSADIWIAINVTSSPLQSQEEGSDDDMPKDSIPGMLLLLQ